jgi:beta,beta-carotene 9',10'-dioxygenase
MEAVETQTVSVTGYMAGFESLESEISVDSLPVEGTIPMWLCGTLLRNGPAKYEAGEKSFGHWFDGLAMLHKFSFAAGCVSYDNRFLRTGAYREAEAGRIPYTGFAADPCRSIFRRMATMFRPRLTDNCNVNLARLGEEYIAMTETPLPVAFDPETLDALGVAYEPPGVLATAHPHHDPERGELIAYATHLGRRPEYRVYAQRDRSHQRLLAAERVSEPSYMHSFALTERYVVLVAFPLVVDPLRLVLGGLRGRSLMENYEWKPEQGTRILLFDRAGGGLRGSFEAEPRFAFHHVNAYEQGGEVTIDMVAYDDASVIADVNRLTLDGLRASPTPAPTSPRLLRYVVSTASGRVAEERLSDVTIELPRIDYRERNARPYRYVYGVSAESDADFLNQLVKVDVESGEARTWFESGSYPGEPVFVSIPNGEREEDEGVLLSVVLDGRSGLSYLLVLDAGSLSELGRARVPHHVPFGFHGDYFG